MSLTDSEKRQIVDMLDRMGSGNRTMVMESENSFLSWLKRAAYWLWDKIAQSLVGRLLSWLWGFFA